MCGQTPGGAVTLLHTDDSAEGGRMLDLQPLVARFEEQGAPRPRLLRTRGSLASAIGEIAPDVVVIGKRGEQSPECSRGLGSNAAAILTGCSQPLCLVSRFFLPIARGLVLIDADGRHRQTVETVAATSTLRDLELDILMMQPGDVDGTRKLAWARRTLGGRRTDVYPLTAARPEAVAATYVAERGADLIVFSREMMFAPGRGHEPAEHRPLWSWRVPVFVC